MNSQEVLGNGISLSVLFKYVSLYILFAWIHIHIQQVILSFS